MASPGLPISSMKVCGIWPIPLNKRYKLARLSFNNFAMANNDLRLLVVTSCTGEKRVKSEKSLIWEDFQDLDRLQARETDLQALAMPAATLYTGAQHLHVMAGVNLLRETFGTNYVDVKILSAGYGLIDEYREVVPYEVTFNDLKLAELDRWSKTLNIREDFEKAIAEYDLIFVLLGERYLRALALPVVTKKEQTLIFFASGKSERYIPPLDGKVFKLVLGNNEAQQFGCALVGLKGFLLERFSHNLKLLPNYLDKVYRYPEFFQTIINQNPKPLQLSLPIILDSKASTIPEKKPLGNIEIPDLPCVQNQHFGLQYYIPEWDDLVDPGYDFLTDSFSLNRKDAYFDQVYAHEIYDRPNYDGILVSKVVIDAKKKKQLLIQEMGIQKFLRFPRQNIMGDCGA
ncbi:MAG: hypothetical protein VKL20_05660, partial [Synechocystis sp.]|nr:hypothetical protein [Synechocystis sp.]